MEYSLFDYNIFQLVTVAYNILQYFSSLCKRLQLQLLFINIIPLLHSKYCEVAMVYIVYRLKLLQVNAAEVVYVKTTTAFNFPNRLSPFFIFCNLDVFLFIFSVMCDLFLFTENI